MRYGCCLGLGQYMPNNGCDPEDATVDAKLKWLRKLVMHLEDVGYSFLEFPVSTLTGTDHEFEGVDDAVRGSGLRAEVFNCFIPADLKVTGPTADMRLLYAFVERVIPRVARLGGQCIVFGSGGARRVPDGYSREVAEEQITDFLRMASVIAANHGITIVIEPLNRRESNVINSVAEGIQSAQRIGTHQVKVLADMYHMYEEAEGFDAVASAGEYLAHVHVADTGRLYPGSGSYDYPSFFRALRAIRYDGRVSVECRLQEFQKETETAIRFMQSVWHAISRGDP